jgi:PD-(D/E)XK nuclease superfamily
MNRHHPTLSPSSLDKKAACLHFTGKPVGKAANRGTELHEKLADAFNRRETPSDPLLKRAADRARNYIASVQGIEEEVQLLDNDLNQTSFGTVDLWGHSQDGGLVLVDWKSGVQSPETYFHQMAFYSLALMEQEDADECQAVIVPIDNDEQEAFATSFTRESAAELIYPLIERIKGMEEGPKENQFCNWCAKRKECPVWTLPAAEAITPVREKLLFTESDALERPEAYMDAFKKLEGIFESWGIKEALKAKLEAGIEVPGWKLQTRKGASSVSSVEEVLMNVLPAIGFAKGADFLKVEVSKMQKAWASFSSNPLPVEIVTGEGTTALVQDKKGVAK